MVIGIHKGSYKRNNKCEYNRGTFLKFPLNELKKSKGRKVSYNNYYIIQCPVSNYITFLEMCIFNKFNYFREA